MRRLFMRRIPLKVLCQIWYAKIGTLGGAAEASGRDTRELHGGPRGRRQAQETPQKAMGRDQLLVTNLEATKWAALKKH